MLHTLNIERVVTASPRARVVRIALNGIDFQFAPGQAVAVASHGQDRRRAYSIAIAPGDVARDDAIELLVGVDEHGSAGPHLELRAGAPVDVDGPLGGFGYSDKALDADRVVFIAGGTGIAPVRGMLRHLIAEPCRIRLVYSARTPADFAYSGELRDLARAGRIDLRETITRVDGSEPWSGARGRITLDDILSDSPSTLYVACGPLPMLIHVLGMLRALGTPEDRILLEEWCRRATAAPSAPALS